MNAQTCNCKTMIVLLRVEIEKRAFLRRPFRLLTQSEVDVNLSDNLNRLSVKEGRLVNPLLNCFGGGGDQQRMTSYELEVLNGTVLADNCGESYDALNTSLLGQRGIGRRNFLHEIGGLHLAADTNTLGSLFDFLDGRGRRSSRGDATHDSTDHATGSAGNTTGDATDDTTSGHGRRQVVFLNDGDVLWNLFGSHEAAGVELTRGDLNNLGSDRRRGRRRRRRRRGRREHGHQRCARQHVRVNQRNDDRDDDDSDLNQERREYRGTFSRCVLRFYESLLEHYPFLAFPNFLLSLTS